MTFSKDVYIGTGDITLTDWVGNTLETVALSQVSKTSNSVTFQFNGLVEDGRDYEVIVPAGAFTDADGLAFSGISAGNWVFNTIDNTSPTRARAADSLALVALYRSTEGANWTNNTNWLSISQPISTWYGVTITDNRVTAVTLVGNNLLGNIPSKLGKIKHLKVLHLSDNQLINSIPKELRYLVELEQCRLDGNQLSGSVPKELGNLTKLRQLYLHRNNLSGSIPTELTSLTNLSALTLDENKLSGLPDLSSLASLDDFSVRDNLLDFNDLYPNRSELTAYSPQANLEDTINVYLDNDSRYVMRVPVQPTGTVYQWKKDGTDIAGATVDSLVIATFAIDSVGKYTAEITHPDLRNLTLVRNPITLFEANRSTDSLALVALYKSTDGANWTNNTNWLSATKPISAWYGVYLNRTGRIYHISLSKNNLTGSIPVELGNLTNLRYLGLWGNQLIGSIPAELGNLTSLIGLSLSSNQLIGSIPAELGNLTNLTLLYLFGNQLSGSIPAELGNLTNLTLLYLSSNQLSGSIPAELGNLTSLIGLSLSSNQLIGSIPAELGNLTNLTLLYLSSNQLSGSIPVELGNLTNLTSLALSSNQLSGSIPVELGNLTNLTELYLSGNQLSGSIPTELSNLTKLEYLGLGGGNQLSGSIPVELGNLTNLTSLSLFGNQLSGSIPVELGNLTNLTFLALSSNQLSGSIPVELGNLTSLTQLPLGNNQLSGSIPAELGNLTKLEYLGLWGNQLSSIPVELGSLTNLTRLDLFGNQLSELPDLSALKDSIYLSVSYNLLDFSDLLPNRAELTSYAPQHLVGDLIRRKVAAGTRYVMRAIAQPSGAVYQWKRYGKDIAEATADSLIIATVAADNVGVYTTEITHPDLGDLTLVHKPVILTLGTNNSPTAITMSSTAIVENAGANAVVGTFSTTDSDVRDSHTYRLATGVGGTDNASFDISSDTLRANVSFDFETKNSYSIRVQTVDNNGDTFSQTFTIRVTNVDDPATNDGFTTFSDTAHWITFTAKPEIGDESIYQIRWDFNPDDDVLYEKEGAEVKHKFAAEGSQMVSQTILNKVSGYKTTHFGTISIIPYNGLAMSKLDPKIGGDSTTILAEEGYIAYQWYRNGEAIASDSTKNSLIPDDLGIYFAIMTDSEGNSFASERIVIDVLTAHPNNDFYSKVVLYPNPTKNLIKLETSLNYQGKILLNIYNLSGKEEGIGKEIDGMLNAVEVDVSTLSSGTYLLYISTAEGKILKRFVKQ